MGARSNYGSGSRDPSGAHDRQEWYRKRDEEIRADQWREQERKRLDDLYNRKDYGAGVTTQRQEDDRRYAERIREDLDRLQEQRRREADRHNRERSGRGSRPCPNCRGDGVADVMSHQVDRDGNLTYMWSRETCRVCGGRREL